MQGLVLVPMVLLLRHRGTFQLISDPLIRLISDPLIQSNWGILDDVVVPTFGERGLVSRWHSVVGSALVAKANEQPVEEA